jgi:hypothetical protein
MKIVLGWRKQLCVLCVLGSLRLYGGLNGFVPPPAAAKT